MNKKTKEMKSKLKPKSSKGYIPIRRDILRLLLEQVEKPTDLTIYVYLLMNANFEDGCIVNGRKLQRGDWLVDLKKLCKFCKKQKSSVYEALTRLIDQGLLCRKEGESGIYRINFYEEHCGCQVSPHKSDHRRTPTASTPEVEEAFDEFFGFYHYMLHMPEPERERAHREWLRLTPEERIHAFEGITPYTQSLRTPDHAKLACTYLKDKSFTTYL